MTTTTATRPKVLSVGTITGNPVRNLHGEDIGKIEEIMLDLDFGRIAYAVLSFGGFLGFGGKYFAIPWDMLALDTENHCFYLNLDKAALEKAPGFDKDDWPDFTDRDWGASIYLHYDREIYW